MSAHRARQRPRSLFRTFWNAVDGRPVTRAPAQRFELPLGPLIARTPDAALAAHLSRSLLQYAGPAQTARRGPACRISLVIAPEPGAGIRLPAATSAATPADWRREGEFHLLTTPREHVVVRLHDLLVLVPRSRRGAATILLCNGPQASQPDGFPSPFRRTGPFAVDAELLTDLLLVTYAFRNRACCLHAAALRTGDGCLLLLGPSGAGKTTTALSLLRGGWPLLSEEIVLLRGQKTVTAIGILQPPRLATPALRTLGDLEKTLGADDRNGKESCACAEIQQAPGAQVPARVRGLVFIDPSREKTHTLSPLSTTETLVSLMNQVLRLPEPGARDRELTLLTRLAASCPAHRLRLGPDLAALPGLLRSCLA